MIADLASSRIGSYTVSRARERQFRISLLGAKLEKAEQVDERVFDAIEEIVRAHDLREANGSGLFYDRKF